MKLMIRVGTVLLLVLFTGCGGKRIVLGNEPLTRLPDKIKTVEGSEVPVFIKGEVIEKGKRWLIVKDDTDKIKVETASIGADVDDIPLHGRVAVAGVCKPNRILEATGVRTE
jgi:hypothetical protein